MPSPRSDPVPTLPIYPHQVHIGDRFTDADTDGAAEWEVVSRPVTFKKGHEVRARVQRPGDPGTAREKYWAAHVKITVRRNVASRPTPDLNDAPRTEELQAELRRLRGEVRRLEEDKRLLDERIAHLQRELKQPRAKV